MGVSGNILGRVVGLALVTASTAAAQSTYPAGTPADPRAASMAPAQPAPAPAPAGYGRAPAYPAPSSYPAGYGSAPAPPQYQHTSPPASPGANYILAPPVLPYREGVEPPSGYVLTSHRNGALMAAGGLSFGGSYAGGLIYAMGKSFDNGTGWLAVPILGPWAAIGKRDFKCDSSSNVDQEDIDKCVDGALGEVTSITVLAMLGILQAVGATIFFTGVADTTEEWVRADLVDVELKATPGQVGESGHGLRLEGRF